MVPNFHNSAQAQQDWSDAGFVTSVIFNPLVPPHYNIHTQSYPQRSMQLCATAVITVGP